jgi:cbb3-type cytochrome oxidase subunit 3
MIDFLITHSRLGGLLLFVSIFLGAIIWMYLPGSSEKFQRSARSILENSDEQF